jgi:hypothetical protein
MSNKPSVTLVLPTEFLMLCRRDNVKPSEVLRGFIADLCGLESREYCTNGSDERMYARAYYERCGYRFAREFDEEMKRRQEGQS